jgi:hypothetical protein
MAITSIVVRRVIAFAYLLRLCHGDYLAANSTITSKAATANLTVPTTSAPNLPTGAALGDLLAAALASAYAGAGVGPPPAEQESRGKKEAAKGGRPSNAQPLAPMAWQPNRPRKRIV